MARPRSILGLTLLLLLSLTGTSRAALIDVVFHHLGEQRWVVTATSNGVAGQELRVLSFLIGGVDFATADIRLPNEPGFLNSQGGTSGDVGYDLIVDVTGGHDLVVDPSIFVSVARCCGGPDGSMGPVGTPLDLVNFSGDPIDAIIFNFSLNGDWGRCGDAQCSAEQISLTIPEPGLFLLLASSLAAAVVCRCCGSTVRS